jgi:L-seryl-tRNA(Ser) seleniumtransferase
MLSAGEDQLRRRAAILAEETGGDVVSGVARVGGGALPLLELPGPVVAIDAGAAGGADALAARLRQGDPPVMARIRQDRLLLDPRTLTDEEAREAGRRVRAALG